MWVHMKLISQNNRFQTTALVGHRNNSYKNSAVCFIIKMYTICITSHIGISHKTFFILSHNISMLEIKLASSGKVIPYSITVSDSVFLVLTLPSWVKAANRPASWSNWSSTDLCGGILASD